MSSFLLLSRSHLDLAELAIWHVPKVFAAGGGDVILTITQRLCFCQIWTLTTSANFAYSGPCRGSLMLKMMLFRKGMGCSDRTRRRRETGGGSRRDSHATHLMNLNLKPS